MNSINVQEIFCSLQGEGRYSGQPTVFVRFSECNLRCHYCDTPQALRPAKFCSYENLPFSGKTSRIKNDLSVAKIVELIKSLRTTARLISFTGGEPLLYPEIIAEIIQQLGKKYKYLLETNGTLPQNLPLLNNKIDIYSIDIKKGFETKNILFCKKLAKQDKYLKIILEKELVPIKVIKTILQTGISEVYFQPEAGTLIDSRLLLSLIKLLANKKINYKFTVQLHKFMKIK